MEEKKNRLQTIYDDFDSAAAPFKKEAACGRGCAFCCSEAGSIHITSLEGLVIRDRVNRLPRPRQEAVKKALAADMKQREQKKSCVCPFLLKNRACMIYDIRPFACRRIYSLKVCSRDQHPVLSRRVMAMGDEAIRALQQLDDSGYSGHLSYILYMLGTPAFLSTYLAGEFRPEAVSAFGKSHGIVINRLMGRAIEKIRP
jgi:Fe-S-cluster containining protein